jgi:hypothetical protein
MTPPSSCIRSRMIYLTVRTIQHHLHSHVNFSNRLCRLDTRTLQKYLNFHTHCLGFTRLGYTNGALAAGGMQ